MAGAAVVLRHFGARPGARPEQTRVGGPDPSRGYAYVGCFTSRERAAHGEGISAFRVDGATGTWELVQRLRGEVNPSFLVADPGRPCLYASHTDAGQVSAFRVDPLNGSLSPINRQPTGGSNPAHLALDPSGRFLVAANYGGGTVAVVPVLADGSLGTRTDLVEMHGEPGPHRVEQSASHPHQCRFDRTGRILVVPDKGLDRIFFFGLDAGTGRLRLLEPSSVASRPGAGPRHVAFHPAAPRAYVANELDSTVATWRIDDGGSWVPIQILPTVPATFTGANTPAGIELSPSGRFVFVSNRGHDSIVTFAVDRASGALAPVVWTPTGGKTPRFFCLDPSADLLYVANQATDTIVSFRVDPDAGSLAATGQRVETGTPTAIAFRLNG